MERMMKLFIAAVAAALVSTTTLAQDGCFFPDGTEVVVPAGDKIVLVPKTWKPNQIVYVEGGKAHEPVVEIPEECKDYGKLVVGPTVVPEYCSKYFPQ